MRFTTFVNTLACATLALATPTHRIPGGPRKQCPTVHQGYLDRVEEQLTTDQIIPDLIERIKPTVKVNAVYGNKTVRLGRYFTTLQTLTEPTITFSTEEDHDPFTTKYIIFLIDPDVPQDGSQVQVNFNHWTVANAQPSCVDSQQRATIVAYEPLTPLSTTQHRYTFLVYRQPEKFNPLDLTTDALLNVRTPFDLNDFVYDHHLRLVGANFLKESITNGLQGS